MIDHLTHTTHMSTVTFGMMNEVRKINRTIKIPITSSKTPDRTAYMIHAKQNQTYHYVKNFSTLVYKPTSNN